MASLQTRLCRALNIDTPIVQAPIGPATNPALAAAVSNAGGLGMLAFLRRDADDVREIGIEDAPAWIESHEAVMLDVREPVEYSAGHLPGAISIPQAELATRLDEVPKDRDLVVACAGGLRSANCTAFLSQQGFSRAISLAGGTDGWRNAGLPIEFNHG